MTAPDRCDLLCLDLSKAEAPVRHVELATMVQSKLCVKWSPEQISLHLAERFADWQEMRVCAETDLPVVNGAVMQAVERQIRALVGVPACLVDIEFNAQTGLLTGV